MSRVLDIVTAVIRDADGRMLLVRKRGTATFMKPGGKRDAGEDDLTTLARELDEELGCRLVHAELLGHFSAPAANEAGFTVQSVTYLATVEGRHRCSSRDRRTGLDRPGRAGRSASRASADRASPAGAAWPRLEPVPFRWNHLNGINRL